ncbi:hypothetical protein [Cytophaga hutchinsonii]|uniref:Uncharacterized protein n=1 Tax=Cytophaga hutchinsonii (strain ATCC 33406 / DSM 1761 / CIP 103989 / NBRC 15051 / NCIMB 9469 / D465) TaxID=269798 RepID=A0A6N4SQ21_CYTH3|nr:hypothetical protein [Cytophaga hutchinsonii]ABG58450.1 hypothetical protein CHU_1175 [Cytophaga hutchinsonii ATCC 33406]SFX74688.1 hypothetical protein SAMN04487930_10916 [Cytophaga hutchinsonii ATCC 33406]
MNYIKNIFTYLGISFILTILSNALESDFWAKFLDGNLIVILITLLAINTATISLIISKMQEIAEKHIIDFDGAIKEVKKSLYEQIILIALAIVFLILKDSSVIKTTFKYHDVAFNTIIGSIFINSIDILRDTGVAIFEILKFNNRK